MLENGGKWRFFEGPKRHFAVPEATALDRNSSVRPTLRPRSPAASSGLWPAKSQWSAIFHRLGHESTHVGPVRFDDRADFVARVGQPARREAVPSPARCGVARSGPNGAEHQSPGSRSAPWVGTGDSQSSPYPTATPTGLYVKAQGRAAHPGLARRPSIQS